MSYEFHHGSELLTLCSRYKISIGEVMLRREMEDTTRTREEIFAEMKLNLDVMRTSIRTGLDPTVPTRGLMAGNESVKLARYAQNSELGGRLCGIVAAGMAVAEVNASMGQIVAEPAAFCRPSWSAAVRSSTWTTKRCAWRCLRRVQW